MIIKTDWYSRKTEALQKKICTSKTADLFLPKQKYLTKQNMMLTA